MAKKNGVLFLISGPSQVGKDSIIHALLRRPSLKLRKLVTMTTRPPRPGEVKKRWYNFVTEAEFNRMIKADEFLEWEPVRGYKFGTPKEPLRTWLAQGHRVLQQADVRGAATMRKISWLNIVTIFVMPGSIDDLKQRLAKKKFSPEQRRIRWQETLHELTEQPKFDFRVVNEWGKLKQAVDEVAEYIKAVKG